MGRLSIVLSCRPPGLAGACLLGLALLLAAAASARGQTLVTEVVELRYRSADEVVELLRPLVPPPGVVSGLGGQLLLRTTAENLQDLRAALAAIDRAPRQLLITVSHGVQQRSERQRHYATRSRDGVNAEQRVQVLEGREAFISTGRAVPLRDRAVILGPGQRATVLDSSRYEDVSSGFRVRPRLLGEDEVLLEIAPQRERLRASGDIERHAAQSTLRAGLGEWVELGGGGSVTRREDRHGRYSTLREEQRIFVKVEVLR